MNENNKTFKNVDDNLTNKQEKELDKVIKLLDDNDLSIDNVCQGIGI